MEIRTTTPSDSPPFQRNLKNKKLPHKRPLVRVGWGLAGLAQSWLEQSSYKRCLSWVRIPDPAFQDDMLILNILDDISNREFKIALVTLLEGLENVMFLRKTSDSWLGLEEYKTQKGSSEYGFICQDGRAETSRVVT